MITAPCKLSGSVEKIISGGQTGADWAALDFAILYNLPHGGWCPKGRLAENGTIDERFNLKETPSDDYLQRTEWNVRDSDGTVIFSIGPTLTGGSKHTAEFAVKHQKPCRHISAAHSTEPPESALVRFIQQNQISVLNVAGPRAFEEPGVGQFVEQVLEKAFAQGKNQ